MFLQARVPLEPLKFLFVGDLVEIGVGHRFDERGHLGGIVARQGEAEDLPFEFCFDLLLEPFGGVSLLLDDVQLSHFGLNDDLAENQALDQCHLGSLVGLGVGAGILWSRR